MKNKTYDIIKIIVLIVLPSLTTFIGVTLEALNCSYTGVVITIMTAFSAMCGGIIEKISANYKKNILK